MTKSYFPAPNFDHGPEGDIALGNIIWDPLRPEETLCDKPVTVTKDETKRHWKYDVDTSLTTSSAKSGSLFAKVLNLVGIKLGGGVDEQSSIDATVKKLETLTFKPSDEYLEESIASPKIQRYLASSFFRKRIFIITGIKIAYGASTKTAETRGTNGNASAEVDGGSVGGIPASAGAEADFSTRSEQKFSFKGSTPFVFAYRLREIRYRGQSLEGTPYEDGALYGVGSRPGGGEETVLPERATFLDLDDDDVTGEDIGLESVSVGEETRTRTGGGEGDDSDTEDEDCELVLCV